MKGYIDLSKRRVSPEDITKCEERFTKSKTVASILRHVASKLSGEDVAPEHPASPTKEGGGGAQAEEEEDAAAPIRGGDESRLELLYEQIGWLLGRQYGHPFDAFKIALTYICNNDLRATA